MLKFDSKEPYASKFVEVTLSQKDICNIMVTGLEGGIGYWAVLDNSKTEWKDKPKGEPSSMWATKLLIEDKEVHFYDAEDEDEKWVLTLPRLLSGYAQNMRERPHDSNIENGDADTADCIIQYALFNKLVYG